MDRRTFLLGSLGGLLATLPRREKHIMTVRGAISRRELGTTLVHEHFLVDFIGADKTHPGRWNRAAVVEKVLPYLAAARAQGVRTVFDCTPAFLGRDVLLLRQLADRSGLQLVTNTGYYGAVNNKYLPSWAFTESAEQLAQRWISEAEQGIEGTGIRPGFIKISVDVQEPLSGLHQKLVQAAALTHLQTGLTICSHTGLAAGAFQQLDILQKAGVHPNAFVWVHAQAEKDRSAYVRAAARGAWISLDGLGWGEVERYAETLQFLKGEKLLHRVLLSHDAGWYKPDEPAAPFQGYTALFTGLLPRLRQQGFSKRELNGLLRDNPAAAMQVGVRRYGNLQ